LAFPHLRAKAVEATRVRLCLWKILKEKTARLDAMQHPQQVRTHQQIQLNACQMPHPKPEWIPPLAGE
jgi:hypothetical protein